MFEEAGITLTVTLIALGAVWIPFYRGLRLCRAASIATRRLKREEIDAHLRQGAGTAQPISIQLLQLIRRALHENREGHPSEFIVDASRQYVTSEWDALYAKPISMYANVLPPIGFIGTTGGLLVLFLSMRVANENLELGALAVALISSLFALIGFTVLEGMKIRLYGRMVAGIDEAIAYYRVRTAGRS